VTLARLSQRFRARSIKITDKRVGLMVELLTSIKLIKMYAWEMSFARKITDIRAEEKSVLEKSLFVQSVNVGSSMLVPLMASCLTFIGYVATGNNLTATQAFTFVSLLNTIQASMATLPFALKAVSEMVVTTRRIQEILLMEEMKPYPKLPASSPNMVEMVGATFSWSGLLSTKNEEEDKTGKTNEDSLQGKKRKRLKRMKNTDTSSNEPGGKGGGDEKQNLKEDMENTNPIFVGPTLRNFTFTLKKGHLLGVCGNVASGKTSFINAILGKMDLTSGTVTVSGQPVAYVPQQAWLTQGTLRENILFGEPYEEDRYHQVVQACALTEDFASFPSGDVTQMDLTSGTVTVSGQPVAYVPQQAWLTQGTLRENILFGEPYEEDRYHQVVQACALTEDFASFPSGDATQIGECGSTLSGGQKQRLSLARAAYSKHDLVLLDDPLSAVDIHLARHIFQECILAWFMGRGKQGNGSEEGTGRTVVFVSHLIEYMKECDQILVIKDGTIAEQGSHKELLTEGNSSSGSEQVSEEGRKSSVTSGDYAFLLRLYQEYQATQGSEPTQQSHQDGEGGETTMLNESGDMTQMQNSIVSSERKVLDEGFPARVPDVVSDHNSNGVHYKPKIETITPYEAGSSKKELKAPASSSHSDPAPLIEEEQVDTGALSLSVVQQWILSMGGYPVLLLVFIIFCLPVAGTTTASWYLSYWIEQGGGVPMGNCWFP
ncbi:multidrug resistance-associated protein 9, partial [Plakobranchus ocellatus]